MRVNTGHLHPPPPHTPLARDLRSNLLGQPPGLLPKGICQTTEFIALLQHFGNAETKQVHSMLSPRVADFLSSPFCSVFRDVLFPAPWQQVRTASQSSNRPQPSLRGSFELSCCLFSPGSSDRYAGTAAETHGTLTRMRACCGARTSKADHVRVRRGDQCVWSLRLVWCSAPAPPPC